MILGWAEGIMWDYPMFIPPGQWNWNWGLCLPIVFPGGPDHLVGFGSFRMPNCRQFNQYVTGRYYDPVWYAPKDKVARAAIEACLDYPGEFCIAAGWLITYWSSYCLSPAAMFSPDVMANPEAGGWSNPWELPGGFRSPAMSQALYADLKTHMLEHHWLQNSRQDCNTSFTNQLFNGGTYDGCQPFFFNHGWESVPVTLFYEGQIEGLGVREAMMASSRNEAQAGYKLWHDRIPGWMNSGYFSELGYDWSNTSYHVLTTDGIRGRDKLGD